MLSTMEQSADIDAPACEWCMGRDVDGQHENGCRLGLGPDEVLGTIHGGELTVLVQREHFTAGEVCAGRHCSDHTVCRAEDSQREACERLTHDMPEVKCPCVIPPGDDHA